MTKASNLGFAEGRRAPKKDFRGGLLMLDTLLGVCAAFYYDYICAAIDLMMRTRPGRRSNRKLAPSLQTSRALEAPPRSCISHETPNVFRRMYILRGVVRKPSVAYK